MYVDYGLRSAALFLDMSKAFDKVPHCHLLQSLAAVGVSGPLGSRVTTYVLNDFFVISLFAQVSPKGPY